MIRFEPVNDTSTHPTADPGQPPVQLHASSVGEPVAQLAQSTPVGLFLLSRHAQVTNLLTMAGDLVAVVSDAVGPGPFNVVVPGWEMSAALLDDRGNGHLMAYGLRVGRFAIHWQPTARWNPQPDWPRLGASLHLIPSLGQLRAWLRQQPPYAGVWIDDATRAVLRQQTARVTSGSTAELWRGLAGLLGLGPGLTPLGDDWLAGWLLRRHLSFHSTRPPADLPGQPAGDMITAFLIETAADRTTRLSQAWLKAAAAGWVDEPWLQLLHALTGGTVADIERATARIMQHGATSGYAMLAGFLQELLS